MAQDERYETLTKILDALCNEAPVSAKIYHPKRGNAEAKIHARSRAYLHLFLKVKFGLLSFKERELHVTDGPFDGGIDAYYLDHDEKVIYCLQSKFRATADNFVKKQITPEDLIKVQLKRIVNGEKTDLAGGSYNNAIKLFQRKIRKIPDIGRYKYKVVLLANNKSLHKDQLQRLCEDFPIEQYDSAKIYGELVFPLVNGIYYSRPNLTININLDNVRGGKDHLNYTVKAERQSADVMLLFVPTKEVGRILHTYKNSILRFNPRSFLELKNNTVNQEIRRSVISTNSNEFALFNNGITLLSDGTNLNTSVGRKGAGQLAVTNPQIINGAQTAFTLSRVYEDLLNKRVSAKVFNGKEVLLRVITFDRPSKTKLKQQAAIQVLISDISKASNSQTRVEEADRRANEVVLIELQKKFFDKFGLFYERKRGEFADGIREKYIDSSLMVDREKLMRLALAIDQKSSLAKSSMKKFFSEDGFRTAPLRISQIDRYAFGYEVLRKLERLRRSPGRAIGRANAGLRYGQYAMVSAIVDRLFPRNLSPEDAINIVLPQWRDFEVWAKRKPRNARYFRGQGSGFVSYYKGSTINRDVMAYPFRLSPTRPKSHA